MFSIKIAYPADVGLTLRFTPYNIRSVITNLIFPYTIADGRKRRVNPTQNHAFTVF